MRRIVAYTASLSYPGFLADSRTQDAVIRNLQIMGEATKRLSTRFKQAHSEIPWREMAGMRDISLAVQKPLGFPKTPRV